MAQKANDIFIIHILAAWTHETYSLFIFYLIALPLCGNVKSDEAHCLTINMLLYQLINDNCREGFHAIKGQF